MVYFIPTTEKISVEGLARLFRDNMQKLHGLPKSIISDKGSQFIVRIMWELNRILETKSKLSTVFHPQTDGQTKRVNQKLEQYLRIFINYKQKQQPDWLGTAKFAYNNKVYSDTRMSPFKVNYRQDPRIGFETRRKGKYKKVEKFVTKMKKIQKETKVALEKVQEEIVTNFIQTITLGILNQF